MSIKRSITILVSLTADEDVLRKIRQSCPGCEIRVGPWIDDTGQEMPVDLMRGIDVLFCEYPPENFNEFDQLKWIQLTSSGYTQVLELPILERGIRVTNGLGNFDVPIAEWNIMMMLMWQRDLLDQLDNQKNKIWDRDARFQRDVFGSTVGFYGYGGIARETARLAKAMHLQVWALTRDGKIKPRPLTYCVEGTGDPDGVLPDQAFSPSQVEQFLSGLDYLFVSLPLTPATEGLITENQLRLLPASSVVINPARAAIIEEEAFISCLQQNWIRGASLDVHYAYPLPPDHPLWEMPNLIMTPHVSGSSASPHFLERFYDIATQNLERFINCQPLLNELTASQLSGQ